VTGGWTLPGQNDLFSRCSAYAGEQGMTKDDVTAGLGRSGLMCWKLFIARIIDAFASEPSPT